jgi:hypothetical protein
MAETEIDKYDYPLWKKIIAALFVLIILLILLWGLDKIGILGFFAGAGF